MSPQPDLTGILEELASGRIDAAEAARRIDALKAETAAETDASSERIARTQQRGHRARGERPRSDRGRLGLQPPTARSTRASPGKASEPSRRASPEGETPRQRPINTGGVERITVRAVGRRVRIIGETSVATLSADGPHVLRRNGAVLEVSSDGEVGSSVDGFSILRAPRSLDDFRSLGLGKELFLRVNPNITVDVEVTAGSLNTERVPHLGKIRVTAGGAKLLDVQGAQRRLGAGRPGHHQGRDQDRPVPDPGRVGLAEHRAGRRLQRHGEGRRAARQGQLERWTQRARRRGRDGQRQRPARRRGRDGLRPGPGGLGPDGARGGSRRERASPSTGRPRPARAPRAQRLPGVR